MRLNAPLGSPMTARKQLGGVLAVGFAALTGLSAQVGRVSPDPRLAEAAALIRHGAPAEAVAVLDAVLVSRPEDAQGHLLRGRALALIPRREESVEALLRAMELRPEDAEVHASAGSALARLGESEAARQVFERSVALDGNVAGSRLSLALLLAGAGEFDRAAEHLSKALSLESDPTRRARLHYLNGKLHVERGQIEAGAGEFERAVELDPESAEACLALGLARKRLLREDDAYPMLRRAVELAPRDPLALYHLALELQRRGDAGGAARHLLRAHEIRPADQSIVYNLSRALHSAGRRAEAKTYRSKLQGMIASADRAREHELRTAQIHADAVRLEGQGDYAAALDKYRAVLEFAPLNATARRNLALVLCHLGRWSAGIAELEAILRDDPDNAEVTRLLPLVLDQARRAGAESGRAQ